MLAFSAWRQTALGPVAALLAGVALLMLGNGLFLTLVPLRADLEGFGTLWTGAIGAAYSVGFVVGCYLVPPLVGQVGHIRVFAALAALGAIVPLLHPLALTPALWAVFRIVIGLCISGLYMVIESWLNAAAGRSSRGSVLGAYIAIHLAAVTAGQYLLLLGAPDRGELFSLVAMLFALAVIPVCLTRAPSPPLPVRVRPDLRKLWRNSQVAVAGSLTGGMVSGATWSLTPVYAKDLGLPVTAIAAFVSVAIIGGAIVQYPLGRLSDRLPDRRWLIVTVCAVAAVTGQILLAAASQPALTVYAAYFVFGAAAFSLYGVCVAHANDQAESTDFVEISAGLLLLFAIGAVAGPLIASALMGQFGAGYLFLFTSIVHGAMAIWTYWRTRRRQPISPAERSEYVPMTRTSPNIIAIDPRAVEPPPESAEHRAKTDAA